MKRVLKAMNRITDATHVLPCAISASYITARHVSDGGPFCKSDLLFENKTHSNRFSVEKDNTIQRKQIVAK